MLDLLRLPFFYSASFIQNLKKHFNLQQQIANLLPLENSTLEGANYILTNRPEYTWKPSSAVLFLNGNDTRKEASNRKTNKDNIFCFNTLL
jgi:hypothetical protein